MNTELTAKVIKELGHPIRLKIIKELMKHDSISVGELQKILNIPNSTLSHHISSLISVGLITQKRSGTTLFCSRNSALVSELSDFLITKCCDDDRCDC